MDANLGTVVEKLSRLDGVAICFSGGLDSTVLADLAVRALGDRAVAVMVDVPMMTSRQRDAAMRIASSIGIRLVTAKLGYGDLPDILENTHDRCYICKTAMYRAVRAKADELGIGTVVNGEIVDDLSEDRPGMRAGEENGIVRPFIDAGIGRESIREHIESMDLPLKMVKDTCMLMRYPEGMPVTEGDLKTIEELESEVRRVSGLAQLRVRRKGDRYTVQTSSAERDVMLDSLDAIGDVFIDRGLDFEIVTDGYDK